MAERPALPDYLPERAWTEQLESFFATDERVAIGLGDDAAVLRRGDSDLVVCCDPVVEGRHFRSGDPLGAVGRKAVARNLSDLAAMGARPEAVVVSVLLPESCDASARQALFEGLREATESVGAIVIGGDTGSTDGPLTVTVTALGRTVGRPLPRRGARIGDDLFVSGPLGGSAFVDTDSETLPRHLRIRPRLALGMELAQDRAVHAAIDISDGLALDLFTMCRASDVPGAELDADSIPIHVDALRASGESGRSALDHALFDGEDHELLFAVESGHRPPGEGLRRIGRLVSDPGLRLTFSDGRREPLSPRGFQHGRME